ncbi:MAG: hypothetical protein MUE62_06210, partial [Burkholderiaceae bacterium]|nr:hypothetical protein [Burkholderiaceae bacterium]
MIEGHAFAVSDRFGAGAGAARRETAGGKRPVHEARRAVVQRSDYLCGDLMSTEVAARRRSRPSLRATNPRLS